jgi:hypothetical protein
MGFVNEKIDTPERIREFDQLNLISPLTRRPPERWKWTVDRERGFYLIALGGGFSEIPHIYALVVPNGVVRFEGEVEGKEHLHRSKWTVQIKWQISRVDIPRALAPRATELLSVVREALTASGLFFDSERVKSVKVTLPSPTFV